MLLPIECVCIYSGLEAQNYSTGSRALCVKTVAFVSVPPLTAS